MCGWQQKCQQTGCCCGSSRRMEHCRGFQKDPVAFSFGIRAGQNKVNEARKMKGDWQIGSVMTPCNIGTRKTQPVRVLLVRQDGSSQNLRGNERGETDDLAAKSNGCRLGKETGHPFAVQPYSATLNFSRRIGCRLCQSAGRFVAVPTGA